MQTKPVTVRQLIDVLMTMAPSYERDITLDACEVILNHTNEWAEVLASYPQLTKEATGYETYNPS